MTDKDEYRQVLLKLNRIEADVGLPLDDEGNLLPQVRPFQTVESLAELWFEVSQKLGNGVPVSAADGKAMQILMELMLEPAGEKFLKLIREHDRQVYPNFMQQFADQRAIEREATADPDDENLDTIKRQARRAKERLAKKRGKP